jgi:ethanolamine permease
VTRVSTASPSTPASPSDAQLRGGTLGWTHVASLGVAIAISGSFSGWNYGLAVGGLGGMFVAALAMAMLFFFLTQCVAELAAALPGEGGFDGYARFALGPMAGYACGMATSIALALGAGLALTFIDAYASTSFGIGGWALKVGVMAAVVALQWRGAKDAASATMLTGCVALLTLVGFCVYVAPDFDMGNWLAKGTGQAGTLLPAGLAGAVQCVPFALFLFLGVEQAAHAASEMKDMTRSLPKALLASIGIVATVGIAVLLLATGAGGVERLAPSNDPLLEVVQSHPGRAGAALMTGFMGAGVLFSLVATFFSLTYAASRQFHHLARAGDLPRWLVRTNARQAPTTSLGLVVAVGLVAAALPPDSVMVVFIFLISLSHLLLIGSFIRLRMRRHELTRPYRAIGGQAMAWLAGAMSCVVVASCQRMQPTAVNWTIAGLVVLLACYRLARRAAPSLASKSIQ